jgi:hypothetical protein
VPGENAGAGEIGGRGGTGTDIENGSFGDEDTGNLVLLLGAATWQQSSSASALGETIRRAAVAPKGPGDAEF